MIGTVLVANRGEIAVRIMRTARAMGIRSIAVYSDVDAGALHVEMADQAVPIGGARPGESYLCGDKILAAAKAAGAEAIHPGYGFLSENPDFVDAVEAAGLTFIGPPAAAIRAMGLKDAAKKAMAAAGVPVVPGYHGADQRPEALARAAAEIGYPVLIKAVAGGGGRGMRLVAAPAEFDAALASAVREAQAAFGNGAVLVEKLIETPRHVEVQVFGDRHGRVVHLYERDCSLQRRHQKVLEEAPAPGMPDDVRAAMGAAAVRAAEAIGYVGAGTVEFIADARDGLRADGFWFMEMNTRLQVEHPVTEAVTGTDLVEWQFRVAAGEPLPLAQADIPLAGHAVEARLYAEDVPAGFLPATGRLHHVRMPSGVRVEAGVREGDEVSPHYDPMIAKVIASGATRGEAFRRLSRALAATEVAGVVTNLGFLGRLAAHPAVRDGAVETGLIARELDALAPKVPPSAAVLARAAVAVAGLEGPLPAAAGFALWAPLSHRVLFSDPEVEVRLTLRSAVQIAAETPAGAAVLDWRNGGWHVEGRRVTAVMGAGAVTVFEGEPWRLAVPDPLARSGERSGGGDVVVAPMPGLVRSIAVAPGSEVTAGAALAVLEAMKMEHVLVAPRDGVVAEVAVAPGDQVAAGAPMVRMAPEAAALAEVAPASAPQGDAA